MANGIPGIGNSRTAQAREIFLTAQGIQYLPGGKIIDGAKSRDLLNVGDEDVLRAGVIMGKITASGKYAPSILGNLAVLHDTSEDTTSLTVPVAVAAEIVRRIGATGTIKVAGPPTAGGTVSVVSKTYTAVNTTTGVVTLSSALAKDFIVGSFVMAADGSETPTSFICDEWGLKVTDEDRDSVDTAWPLIPLAGIVNTANLVNYPADAALKTWIKSQLKTYSPTLRFSDDL